MGEPHLLLVLPDEDLVGMGIEIAQSAHMATVAVTALIKWLLFAFDCGPDEE